MAFNVQAAIAAAKATGPNMTEAAAGGGRELPVAGMVRLRFVGFFELGKHESTWQGVKKVADRYEAVFELSGPKHPPIVTDNGTYPQRITVKGKLSLNSRATFYKLFSAMNYDGKATHIAELLGNPFLGTVSHNTTKIDGKDVTFANLEDIRKPFVTDPDSGDEKAVNVDPPLTELKLYLWELATPDMWDAIFIPGEYEAREAKDGRPAVPAKSKNLIQNKIKSALNLKASPIYDYIVGKVSAADTAALDEAVGGTAEAGDPEDAMEGIA